MTIISNTSPITNLAAIGYLDLLRELYGTIIIPQAVYDEMTNLGYVVPGTIEVQTLTWIHKQKITNQTLAQELQNEIDPGEAEVIVLGLEIKADQVIIDDYQGRLIALQYGLKVRGILGILLLAKIQGLIPRVKPAMDLLITVANFRVNSQLYQKVLQDSGE